METEKADKSEEKVYTTPQLVVHGTMAEITAQINKDYGPGDGYSFQNNPIDFT